MTPAVSANDSTPEGTAPEGISHDDRLLGTTRLLSAFIAPFLLVAFVILYGFPGETKRLWSWTIQSHLTSMLLASAYLGGCYFFVRVVFVERHWAAVRAGFVAVTIFASLLGVATIVHWDRFSHGNVAFWIWTALYFTAPFLVAASWVTNQRYAAPPGAAQARVPAGARWAVAGVSGLALVTGVVLFLTPVWAARLWPWTLTPLTARVVGATFCLGSAGLVVLVDDRLEAVRLMNEVQLVVFALILLGAVRSRHELIGDRPLTWVMGVAFVALFVVSAAVPFATARSRGPGRPLAPLPSKE
ncbi:hypothetical protein [Pedococcus sp. 5OH_020]|uniref:hypothetical protein n=1 Tax=Pedococcus sp. 5OH_020 TaxID=2989814 RepID=UPI0022E9A428|nr:hypothetical protein [Pedococcus sp. 5OH_020]